jgi:hypothetical protein
MQLQIEKWRGFFLTVYKLECTVSSVTTVAGIVNRKGT